MIAPGAPSSASTTRWTGCQPVRMLALPDSSSATKNACCRKGLPGPAQAFHSDAAMSAARLTMRAVTSGALASGIHRDDRIDLDRHAERKDRHADRGPRMATLLPEHFDHQVADAVRDLRLIGEIDGRADENAQLDDALHAVERAEHGIHLRQQADAAAAGGGGGPLHRPV